MDGILSGMRIVEGSAFIAAPLGGMTLAQLGADVIRFDPIGGGLDYRRWPITEQGTSLFWHGMNKGKRSIQIDIRKPEGQDIIKELLARPGDDGGMFLTNFPARGWLSDESLRSAREDLIYVNVLGDRNGGSAVDYTVNCAVGFTDTTGDPDSDNPTNYVLPAWDNITGQMAAVALLAAERHRRRVGKGQYLSIALKDVALATTGHLGNIAEVQINHADRARHGNYLFGGFGRDFVSRDGRRLMLVGLTLRQWQGIVKATKLETEFKRLEQEMALDFDQEGDRFIARLELSSLVQGWFDLHDLAYIQPLLTSNAVCFGPYQSFREMVEQDIDCTEQNPLFQTVDQPGIGEYLVPGSPIRFGDAPNLPSLKAPTLGQHTDEILAEDLGLGSNAIGRLHDAGIVA
jgi:2-methylfumaryl-CoA isomerase